MLYESRKLGGVEADQQSYPWNRYLPKRGCGSSTSTEFNLHDPIAKDISYFSKII